jgi:very-short-patch-repair endonuclease
MHGHRLSAHRTAQLAGYADRMRWQPTASEARLWESLRGAKLGVTFRRQVRLGEYIADFVAHSVRLVVEVDGTAHAGRERSDARRDRELRRIGFAVLRLDARLVMGEHAAVVARVREAVAALR